MFEWLRHRELRPKRPSACERAAPLHPGWTIDQATGVWLWNAYPEFYLGARWTGSHDSDGRGCGEGTLT